MKTISASLFAAACVAAASAAQALPRMDYAQSRDDKLSFELFAGGNVGMPGSLRETGVPFQSSAGTATYNDVKFDDAFSHRLSGGAELGYAFTDHLSAFARAAYNEFDGDRARIGELAPANTESTRAIEAQFGDAASREFDLGARYTFSPWGKVYPFAGAALGATHLSATHAAIDNLDGFGKTNVEFGQRQTVFSQRAELGLQFSPVRNFDLRLTAAADHIASDRRSQDPNLVSLGLENVRSEVGDHWDYPAELGAVWHF